jgi:MutL C terminal dimerisation domain
VKQVEAQAEALAALGFVVARFSATEVVVRALPASVADVEPAEVLRVALAAPGDVRDAWAEKLPPAPVPEDLHVRAEILGLAVGPRVGEVKLP